MEKSADPALQKIRRICFASPPRPNLPRILELLGSMSNLETAVDTDSELCVGVSYELGEHTLEQLENHLAHHGCHLDNSLLHKIKRALIYYSEACQLENLEAPTREQRLRSIYLSAAHPPEHLMNPESAEEYLDRDQ